jgi:hypothetical protein
MDCGENQRDPRVVDLVRMQSFSQKKEMDGLMDRMTTRIIMSVTERFSFGEEEEVIADEDGREFSEQFTRRKTDDLDPKEEDKPRIYIIGDWRRDVF